MLLLNAIMVLLLIYPLGFYGTCAVIECHYAVIDCIIIVIITGFMEPVLLLNTIIVIIMGFHGCY